MQSDPGPSVDQVVAGQAYSANNTLVTPVAAHTIDLPYAFTDANESVSDVDMASAYNVYFVGQDNNTNPSPNRMTSVSHHSDGSGPASWLHCVYITAESQLHHTLHDGSKAGMT